jgi:hypothetical protein
MLIFYFNHSCLFLFYLLKKIDNLQNKYIGKACVLPQAYMPSFLRQA